MSKNEISLEKSKDFKQHVKKAARLGEAKQFLFDEVKKNSRTSPGKQSKEMNKNRRTTVLDHPIN